MSIESFFGPEYWDKSRVSVENRVTSQKLENKKFKENPHGYVFVPRGRKPKETFKAVGETDTFANFDINPYKRLQNLQEWINSMPSSEDRKWFCNILNQNRNEAIALFFQRIGYLFTCNMDELRYALMSSPCEFETDGDYWVSIREFGIFPTQMFWNYLIKIRFFEQLEKGFDIIISPEEKCIVQGLEHANGAGYSMSYKEQDIVKGEQYWYVTNKKRLADGTAHSEAYMPCYPFRLLDGQNPQIICMENAFDFFDVHGELSTYAGMLGKGAAESVGAGTSTDADADADADAGSSKPTTKDKMEPILGIKHANPYYMKFPKVNKYQPRAVKLADIKADPKNYGIVQTMVNQNFQDPASGKPAFVLKRPEIQPHYTNTVNFVGGIW